MQSLLVLVCKGYNEGNLWFTENVTQSLHLNDIIYTIFTEICRLRTHFWSFLVSLNFMVFYATLFAFAFSLLCYCES